jgi:hypothetical protein
MDIPLQLKSVFTSFVGDNGYKFTGLHTIFVLSNANGTLVTYDESSATAPFGSVTLATPDEQELTVNYNQAMVKRIQDTQIQDIPVQGYAKKWAVQQIDQVFIPAHDEYSLAKLVAARPGTNIVTTIPGNWSQVSTSATFESLSLKLGQAINVVKRRGGDNSQMIAWVSYGASAFLSAQINFTGSDQGYKDAQNGYLGRHKGVTIIDTPDDYFPSGVVAIIADKRAIIAVTPKMDPEGNGYKVITDVPLFGGIEIQLRDRGDTFVLNKKANAIVTIEDVATTSTSTTSTSTTTTTTAAPTTTSTTTP